MNKRLKVKILKQALASITVEFHKKPREWRHGLCYHIKNACIDALEENCDSYNFPGEYEQIISFFGIKKPKEVNANSYYWFPLDEEGFYKRVKLLKKAIKKLSPIRL